MAQHVESVPSILAGQGAQDQVILPTSVAVGICVKGIRTRLGRSVVTLSGVALGIAFLMSVLSGFHIKFAMRDHTELAREVSRRVAVLRGEVGSLSERPFVLVFGDASEADRGVVSELQALGADLQVLAGDAPAGMERIESGAELPEGAAAILVGRCGSLVTPATAATLAGRRVYLFDDLSASAAHAMTSQGAEIRKLSIELREAEKQRMERRETQARYRMYWIVVVSLLITVGGISNAMLMSVTERFREIATMKCLGALSSFVVKLFLIESSFMGFAGAVAGVFIGVLFPLLAYSYTFDFATVLTAVQFGVLAVYALVCIVAGVVLAMFAGIYPARVAARMVPAAALSTHV